MERRVARCPLSVPWLTGELADLQVQRGKGLRAQLHPALQDRGESVGLSLVRSDDRVAQPFGLQLRFPRESRRLGGEPLTKLAHLLSPPRE